ncbi:MAG: hypothetical protein AAFV01_10670, partial [Bacteroidota bacterium]
IIEETEASMPDELREELEILSGAIPGIGPSSVPDELTELLDQYGPEIERITGRAVMANPRGFDEKAARELIAFLQERWGERFDAIDTAAKAFDALKFAQVERAAQAQYYSKAFLEYAKETKNTYVAFRVLDFAEVPDYVTAAVLGQKGTFRDIQNPLDATILKTVSLIIAAETNQAKHTVERFYRRHFKDDWIAGGRITRHNQQQKAPDKAHAGEVLIFRDGKAHRVWTDPYVAKTFETTGPGYNRWMVALLRALNAVPRAGYITYNLAFGWWMNPNRDFKRLFKTINPKGKKRLGVREAIRLGFRNRGAAIAWATGNVGRDTPGARKVLELMRSAAILPPGEALAAGRDTASGAIGRVMKRYGVGRQDQSKARRVASQILTGLQLPARFLEVLPKFIAWDALTDREVTGAERSHLVRTRVGTPNVAERGASPYFNHVSLFGNVFVRGWEADIEAATDPQTRGGWWWRTMLLDMVPKVAMAMAASGLVVQALGGDEGDEAAPEDELLVDGLVPSFPPADPRLAAAWFRAFYARVSAYDKANYLIVPINITEPDTETGEQSARYLRVPHDETARPVATVLWNLLDGADKPAARTLMDAVAVGAGQFPGLLPAGDLVGKWGVYASGNNPKDWFYGRDVIQPTNQTRREINPIPALGDMARYSVDQLGFTRLWQADIETGLLEQVALSGTVKRIVKTSSYGLQQDERDVERREQARKADVRAETGVATRARRRDYYRLMRRGDGRSAFESEQYEVLKLWRRQVWMPYDEALIANRIAIEEAEGAERRRLEGLEREMVDELETITRTWFQESERASD